MKFFSQHWKRGYAHAGNRSVYGGRVKSQEEVEALQKRIKAQEKAELEHFEKHFDKAWDEAHQ